MRGLNLNQSQPNGQAAPTAFAVGDRGMLSHDLMVEIMGVVPTFAGKKVTVGFYGNLAFASEALNYINIPQLPPGKIIPTRIAMEIRGFAAHEAAHLLWTDFTAHERVLTDAEKKDKLLKEIHNAIEDYMIERNWLVLYPGTFKNFTATEARCCDHYMVEYRKNPDMAKDLRIVGTVALTWCRSLHFGLQCAGSLQALQTMPPALQQRVQKWFHDILDVETTEEGWEFAKKIVADINAQPFDPQDPPANTNHNPLQNSPMGGGQCPAGGGSGNGNGAGNAQGPGARGGSRGNNQGNGPGGSGQQQPTPMKVGHSLGAAYEDLQVEPPEDGQVSFPVHSNTTSGPAAAALADTDGLQRTLEAEKLVSGTIGTVARTLRRSLVAISRERWKGGREDGLIDDKRLANVLIGATDIYKKKTKAPEIDTAVSILIDCSGSMKGELPICQQLALVLHKSFVGTPIQFEILGFTATDGDDLPENAKTMAQAIEQQNPGHEPDIRGVEIYEFKGFDSPHNVAMTTIGNMTQVPLDGTPTGDAMLIAHERLSRRKERRHVMFVLTDGAPDDVKQCAEACQAIEACGATVMAFGIASDAVKHCFTNWAMLSQASDITATVLSRLESVIFGDRNKRGTKMKNKPTHIRNAA